MERWDELHAFAKKTGFKLLYGLNGFHCTSKTPGACGKHAVGGWKQNVPWDSTNVDALLKYTAQKQFVEQGTLLGFEMAQDAKDKGGLGFSMI